MTSGEGVEGREGLAEGTGVGRGGTFENWDGYDSPVVPDKLLDEGRDCRVR